MFPALERGHHLGHKVVDVEQFHVHIRVVHLDGQIVGNIVAEGRHGTVVVRAAPFAEQVRKTVNQYAYAVLLAVFEEQLLARFLAASVLAVAEAARQRGLNAAAEHYRALVAVLLKSVEQCTRETEVPGHELAVVLGAVHSGEVEHEIGLGTVFVQLLRSRIDIVCVDLAHHEPRMGTVLAVADTLEGSHQVTPHKALGTSNEDIHLLPHLRKFFADVAQAKELFLDLFHVQQLGVAGVELRERVAFRIALAEVLVVIQAAFVARNTIEVPEVDGMGAFLVGQERLVHLFAMTDADDLDLGLVAAEQFTYRFGLRLDGASGSLLHKDVARDAVLEGEQHQVHRLVETHDEARHGTVGNGDGIALANLVYPQRDDGAATAHHVAVTRAANLCLFGSHRTGLGHDDLLHHRLARAHCVHRIGGLVGAQAHHVLDASLDGRSQHVVRTKYVGLDRLEREKLATRHLLERRRMEDVVHPVHRVLDAREVAHVADVEPDLVGHVGHLGLELMAHVVLFFLVAAKNANFANIRLQKAVEHGVTETARAAGNQKSLATENGV